MARSNSFTSTNSGPCCRLSRISILCPSLPSSWCQSGLTPGVHYFLHLQFHYVRTVGVRLAIYFRARFWNETKQSIKKPFFSLHFYYLVIVKWCIQGRTWILPAGGMHISGWPPPPGFFLTWCYIGAHDAWGRGGWTCILCIPPGYAHGCIYQKAISETKFSNSEIMY